MIFLSSVLIFFLLHIPVPWILVGILELRIARYNVNSKKIENFFEELRFPFNTFLKLDSTAYSRHFDITLRNLFDNPSYSGALTQIMIMSIGSLISIIAFTIMAYGSFMDHETGLIINNFFWLSLEIFVIIKLASFGQKLTKIEPSAP